MRPVSKAPRVVVAMCAMLLGIGCGYPPNPPHDVKGYKRMRPRGLNHYPIRTVLLYNLQRTLDPDRPLNSRMASFHLVKVIGAEDAELRPFLAGLVNDPDVPGDLRREVAGVLVPEGEPGKVAAARGRSDATLGAEPTKTSLLVSGDEGNPPKRVE